jgi:hypothetical protein
MFRLATILITSLIALLGCSSIGFVPIDRINIPLKFPKVKLDAQNFKNEMRACVPSYGNEAIEKAFRNFPDSKKSVVISYAHLIDGRTFVVKDTEAICIALSVNKFPIWAAEMIEATVNPNELPQTVADQWNSLIAKQLAIHGRVKVVYPSLLNGNAYFVTYWAEDLYGQRSHYQIRYAYEFKKQGEWTIEPNTLKLEHPLSKGFKFVKRNEDFKKLIFDSKN